MIGGDRRITSYTWPRHLLVHVFEDRDEHRLIAGVDRYDAVIALIRWMSHPTSANLRHVCNARGVFFIAWPNGIGRLTTELPKLLATRRARAR